MKVALVCDVEGLLFLDQGNPSYTGIDKLKFEVNKRLLAPFRYTENGYDIIYDFCVKNKLPITMNLVLSKYKPKPNTPKWIEFGSHTWNHKPLTVCSEDVLKEELKNPHEMVSLTPPMWLIHDFNFKKTIEVHDILKENGFKIYTTRGSSDGYTSFHYDFATIPSSFLGMRCVNISICYDKLSQLNKLKRDLKFYNRHYFDKDTVYVISTHDFVHKDTKKLEALYDVIKHHEIVTLRELV